MSHFDTIKSLANKYVPKSKYYISYVDGDTKVDVYYGYINGSSVIYLQTSNMSVLLDSLGIKSSNDYSIVIGSNLIKFIRNERLYMEVSNSTFIIDLRDKHVSSIGGVYGNYIISSLDIIHNLEQKYTFFVSKACGVHPINNAELFINDLSSSYIELVRIWSIPIYILILMCTLINSLRLSRSINEDIEKLIMIGAKRRLLLRHLLIAILIIIFSSSIIGISLGYVLSQIVARVIYWIFDILIIPIINITTYIELVIFSFISGAVGAIIPLYINIMRCNYA